jgi:hypothetical protein
MMRDLVRKESERLVPRSACDQFRNACAADVAAQPAQQKIEA